MQMAKNQHIYFLTSASGLSAGSFFLAVAWAFLAVREDDARNKENSFLEVIFLSDLFSMGLLFLNILLR